MCITNVPADARVAAEMAATSSSGPHLCIDMWEDVRVDMHAEMFIDTCMGMHLGMGAERGQQGRIVAQE